MYSKFRIYNSKIPPIIKIFEHVAWFNLILARFPAKNPAIAPISMIVPARVIYKVGIIVSISQVSWLRIWLLNFQHTGVSFEHPATLPVREPCSQIVCRVISTQTSCREFDLEDLSKYPTCKNLKRGLGFGLEVKIF